MGQREGMAGSAAFSGELRELLGKWVEEFEVGRKMGKY